MSIFHFMLFVATLLACGSIALIFVRATAPQFAPLSWIAAALALGAGSILLKLTAPDAVGGILPGLALLLSFVLIQVAVVTLCGHTVGVPRLGTALLILEVVTGVCLSRGLGTAHLGAEVIGLLIAFQAGETVLTALQIKSKVNRGPVLLIAIDLLCFIAFNLVRSLLLALGISPEGYPLGDTQALNGAVYLLAILGFNLGFFWLTTELRAIDLEDMAGSDPLTRAANRRTFLQWCDQERDRSLRTEAPFSIVMVDIDHFKAINDTFGHATGDTVICDVVEKMRGALRGIDILGRWGGEEFIVLLRESGLDAARVVAERIRNSVETMDPSAPAIRYGNQRKITVSIGIASHDGREEIAELIASADTALYVAKKSGRNRVQAAGTPSAPEQPPPQDAVEAYVSPVFTVPKLFRRTSR